MCAQQIGRPLPESQWLGKARGKPASRTLRLGDYFGELSLLDRTPRSATVFATSELHVVKLPRQTFLELTQDPEIALKMLRTLGSQIRRLEARSAHNARHHLAKHDHIE